MRRNIFLSYILLSVLTFGPPQLDKEHHAVEDRYPNELPTLRFYQNASWNSLEPLVSNMEDVRKVLGDPVDARDVSQYTEPYPGDRIAKQPVFTYKMNDKWEILVYFARYCFHDLPKDTQGDRLCSIDLIPTKRMPFDPKQLPSVFKKKHVAAVDAAWDEFSDGTGLRYEVYTTRTAYGDEKPGDLSRITYGPPSRDTH